MLKCVIHQQLQIKFSFLRISNSPYAVDFGNDKYLKDFGAAGGGPLKAIQIM